MKCGNPKPKLYQKKCAFMLNFVNQNGSSACHMLCRLKYLMTAEVLCHLIQQFIIAASFVDTIYNFTYLKQFWI